MKLSLIVVLGLAALLALVTQPVASSFPGVTAVSGVCVVAGLVLIGWVLLRTKRDGGFSGGFNQASVLMVQRLPPEDRTLVRQARRYPAAVPARLVDLTTSYARRQAIDNARSAWTMLAILLVNAFYVLTPHGVAVTAMIAGLVALVLVGALIGDYLGQRWATAAAAFEDRAATDRQKH